MDIDSLLVASGAFDESSKTEDVMNKFSELLYEEFQKMTLQEFKQHLHHKVTLEKGTREIVVTFGFDF